MSVEEFLHAQFPTVISSAAGSSANADGPAKSSNLLFHWRDKQQFHYFAKLTRTTVIYSFAK
jgi:hypothetical protein